MTSLEIAELAGKQHKDVLKAIRKMETAWMNVTGRKFALCMKIKELANGVKIETPYYSLTKQGREVAAERTEASREFCKALTLLLQPSEA